VPTTDPDRVHSQLGFADCVRLLGTVAVGRLAYTQSALPAVRPVTFTLDGDDVLVPVRAGSPLLGAVRGAVVAFEADTYDDARTGWTVTVVGPSRILEAAARGRMAGCLIAVRLGLVQGWRTDDLT
jgi:hypothetical protein